MPKSKDNQKSNDITHNESLPATFKIIAGSYEKLLYGLEGTILPDVDQEYKFDLKPIFIFPAHVSCIKAVAASPMGGKWLATGSADEIVKVWDLRRKKEIGGLMHHQGTFLSSFSHFALVNSIINRFDYTLIFPISFPPPLRFRRWHPLSLPHKGLGSTTDAQRP